MILYRSVGLEELALMYDSAMKAFPARLPKRPIFYPVLDLEYARQTASKWNVKNGQFAGYVTEFRVEDDYINKFEKHTVGKSQHQEFWIPAEEIEEFNKHIVGHIKVVEAYFGDAFQGFIPEQFGLQGKNVVEQFTLLANSYVYKRMDFYLEIKRNHKAVFLNYPFWQQYDFKNPGLKEKVIQAIREAWLTSFPQIPLIKPVEQNARTGTETDSPALADPVDEQTEEKPPVTQIASQTPMKPVEDIRPVKRNESPAPSKPIQKDTEPVKPPISRSLIKPNREDTIPGERTDANLLIRPFRQNIPFGKPTGSHPLANPVHQDAGRPRQRDSHLEQAIKLGLNEKVREALAELSRAVEEDPSNVIAHTSLGVAYHRLGEDDRALSCYEAALQIDPKNAEAHYFRANIFYGRGDVREAIAGYTMAIGLNPELIDAHEKPIPQDRLTDYTRSPAETYRIAKTAHRILTLNKMLDTNPRQANLFKERAAEYSRLWNYEQAIADFSAALEIQADDASLLHLRGLAYEQMGQHDRAQDDYQRAVAMNSQLATEYINRGITFGQMGNFRQSIASLSEAIRLAHENPDGYFNRGITYFQIGDLKSAIDDFSNVIRLSPKDDAAYYWRGISNEEAGRQGEAIADYKQFLTLSQDPGAREEVEQRLNQWNDGKQNGERGRGLLSEERQKTNQVESEKSDQKLDLYDLIVALGERALDSIWFGVSVDCRGEKAQELYAFTDHNKPIPGRDLLQITSGVRQTREGDFTAFDPDATSHWLFIRAWEGNGFYIETNDPKSRERLKTQFEWLEEVEGAYPPYEGLFIRS